MWPCEFVACHQSGEIEVALILNFGEKPAFKRLIFDNERKKPRVPTA